MPKVNPEKTTDRESNRIGMYTFISVLESKKILLISSVPNKWRFLPLILSRASMRGFSRRVVEGLLAIARSGTLVVKLRPSRRMRESGRESAPR